MRIEKETAIDKLAEGMIAKTAVVETELIGSGTRIGEFAVIRAGARLGKNVVVHPLVVVESGAEIGNGVEIFPGAYVGKEPRLADFTGRTLEYDKTVSVGANCTIGANAVIYCNVSIGEHTLIGDGVSIRENCVIGEKCILGAHVTVGYNVELHNRIKVMDHTHVVGKSLIEDDVFISLKVGMTNDRFVGARGYEEEQIQGATIRKGARVGVGANLLPGVEIGEQAIVGAGALVTKPVEARTVVMGIPARFARRAQ